MKQFIKISDLVITKARYGKVYQGGTIAGFEVKLFVTFFALALFLPQNYCLVIIWGFLGETFAECLDLEGIIQAGDGNAFLNYRVMYF